MQMRNTGKSESEPKWHPARLCRWFAGIMLLMLVAGVVSWVAGSVRPSVQDPIWNGRRLSYWAQHYWTHQNSRQYYAALDGLGTNAMPYLLGELQAKNPFYAHMGAATAPDFMNWDFAGTRRYHAALALQHLDTNAVPQLLDLALAAPICVTQGELGLECAMVLDRLETPASRQIKDARLNLALRAPEASLRRNACRIFYFGTKPNNEQLGQIVRLLGDTDDSVRAAAARALILWGDTNAASGLSLAATLQDRHPVVRRFAAEAIGRRGTNSLPFLPALREAYLREPSMPQPTNDVDFLIRGPSVQSVNEQRRGFFYAMKQIDPTVDEPATTLK